MTTILGISAFYHDAAAAIIVDGVVVAAAQEERFTRKKHDASFPIHAIEFCLNQAQLEIEDLDHVAFYEKPFLKFGRILETYLAFAPSGFQSFRTSMPIWLKSKLYLSRIILSGLQHRYRKRIIFPEHHQSHAASAFYPSPFDESAILTVDGVGEWATTTLGWGQGRRMQLVQELRFPDSLGLLYSAFTYFCGFRINGGEGKLMGLAPLGEPVYADQILAHLIDVKEDGSFRMNQEFFDYAAGSEMTSARFSTLFGGPPRRAESPIAQREKNLAASIQAITELVLLRMANHLHRQSGKNNLCIAGGVGLNCVANGRLLREGPFENVWVQPAAGDSGGAIGSALFVWHQLLGNDRSAAPMPTPYLGPAITPNEVESKLTAMNAVFNSIGDEASLVEQVTQQLATQKVVGWFQGRAEFGPRALGNRSILADPRDPGMQDKLNRKIKFRESFRPFAPVVLAERCGDYFELDPPSPYMLFASKRRGRVPGTPPISAIPAVTHVDQSARVQTVSETDNPKLYRLIRRFEQSEGCPVLVNTSFNVRGEPIVNNVEDAFQCFMNSDMDAVVIEHCLLLKSEQRNTATTITRNAEDISPWKKVARVWMTLTFPIRWSVANATLALIFLLIVSPIAFVWRRINQDSFHPIDRNTDSYWQPRESNADPLSYFKQY